VILDLYQGYWQGKRLRPGDRILSVDAKPSIQARGRCHPTAPAAPGKPARVEHEYARHGALALLAALDVDTGKAFAATPATTGIAPFMDLMGQVDGLITNGKFCCVRRVRLSLTWWRRPLGLRRSALHTDVALVGEPDDPDLDRLPSVQPAPRRRAPVGSGLPAAGASGRAGRPARPDADR
jgi:hypothetical protein